MPIETRLEAREALVGFFKPASPVRDKKPKEVFRAASELRAVVVATFGCEGPIGVLIANFDRELRMFYDKHRIEIEEEEEEKKSGENKNGEAA